MTENYVNWLTADFNYENKFPQKHEYVLYYPSAHVVRVWKKELTNIIARSMYVQSISNKYL